MTWLKSIETMVHGWHKGLPHLPAGGQKWLGANVWWIALIAAILSGISALFTAIGILGLLSIMGTTAASYYAVPTFTAWAIVTGLVSLVFAVIDAILLGMAVTPLKEGQKKGWVLLFVVWLIGVVGVVVNSILTLNPFGLVFGLLFGALWAAVVGYFIFEIHGQFAHVERSKGVKNGKK